MKNGRATQTAQHRRLRYFRRQAKAASPSIVNHCDYQSVIDADYR